LWCLGPDLRTHWELQLPTPAVTLALDPLGDLLAVSDTAGALHLLQASNGKALWRIDSPRPLHHLAFLPEVPLLIGAADTGLIAAYDPTGTCRWRHGLPAHIGSLAVQGNGKVIALAGFSEGVYCFDHTGQRSKRLARLGPCRRLALSYEGHLVVLETLEGELVLTTAGGAVLNRYSPSGRILSMALDPLGESLLLALTAGGLLELSFQS
jgi:outer membrane protein assembly factor BamB